MGQRAEGGRSAEGANLEMLINLTVKNSVGALNLWSLVGPEQAEPAI